MHLRTRSNPLTYPLFLARRIIIALCPKVVNGLAVLSKRLLQRLRVDRIEFGKKRNRTLIYPDWERSQLPAYADGSAVLLGKCLAVGLNPLPNRRSENRDACVRSPSQFPTLQGPLPRSRCQADRKLSS